MRTRSGKRDIGRLVAIGVCAAAVLGTTPSAVQAAPTATVGSVSVTPDINYGGRTNIVGRLLTSSGRAVSGANVAVDQIRYGLSSWYRVALVKTDTNGYIRLSQPPVYNTNYRIRFGGTATLARSESRPSLTRVHRNVQASANPTSGTEGDQSTFSGRVTPAGQGTPVNIERRTSTGWVRTASTTTAADGSYQVASPIGAPGANSFRANVPAYAGRAESPSAAITMQVKPAPVSLNTLTPVSGDWYATGGPGETPVDINGVRFPDYALIRDCFGRNNDLRVQYNLYAKYNSFSATVGQSDNSNREWKSKLSIYVDRALVRTIDIQFGTAVPVTVPVAGANILEFSMTTVTGGFCPSFPSGAGLGGPLLSY